MKPKVSTTRPAKCRCGAKALYSSPLQASDPDGHHYYSCSQECGRDPAWGKTMKAALKAWNTLQQDVVP